MLQRPDWAHDPEAARPDRDRTSDGDSLKTTVKREIRRILEEPGPIVLPDGSRWWSLADVQQRLRGSSVRSRFQDIMRDHCGDVGPTKEKRPANAPDYYESQWHKSDVRKSRYKIYRKRPVEPDQQPTLF